jgi:hypothetical protein
MSKYYILPTDEASYDLIYDICAESDDLAQKGDPYILLNSEEYESFLKAKEAYEEWQEKLDWIIHLHEKANEKANAKPREPFQTMEDYKKEAEEFLR